MWHPLYTFTGGVAPPVIVVPSTLVLDSIGGKPEKKKRKKSYYDNVDDLVSALSQTESQTEPKTADPPVIKEEHLAENKAQSPSITAMAEAFELAGMKSPERAVSELMEQQEAIDLKRRMNLAAIILLLD